MVPRNRRRKSVSIRSPHKSKGRPPAAASLGSPAAFQSAPLTKARGDLDHLSLVGLRVLFQSAPLTKARGDIGCGMDRMSTPVFQSAPLTKARGDVPSDFCLSPRSCFNPLPSQKQGETLVLNQSVDIDPVSIRSPHKSKGRPVVATFDWRRGRVSIRSPHKSKGRLLWRSDITIFVVFQSAPLTKARGDSL